MISKKDFFMVLFLLSLKIFPQSRIDTVRIPYVYLKKCFIDDDHFYMSNGKCYLNEKPISRQDFDKLVSFRDVVCDSILYQAQGKYIKFYINDTIVKQEGVWYREFYVGLYKEYYENGILKILGHYSDGKDGKQEGKKIGKWFYYNKSGKIIKETDYSKAKSKIKVPNSANSSD